MSWPGRKIHYIGEYDANGGMYYIAYTIMENSSVTMFVSLRFCHIGASLIDPATVWVGPSTWIQKLLYAPLNEGKMTFVTNVHGQFSFFLALNSSHDYMGKYDLYVQVGFADQSIDPCLFAIYSLCPII